MLNLISGEYYDQKCYCGPMCDVSCCKIVLYGRWQELMQLVETDTGYGFRIGSFGNGWNVRILVLRLIGIARKAKFQLR